MSTIPITNGGFETGSFSGWTYTYTSGHGGLLTVSSVDKHTGNYGIYGVCPFAGTENGKLEQSIADWEKYKGLTVTWELWSHILFQGTSDYVRVRITDGVSGGGGYVQWGWNAVEASWTKHTSSYTFPSNATEFTVMLWYDWHYPSALENLYGYIDDFSLEVIGLQSPKNRVLIIP